MAAQYAVWLVFAPDGRPLTYACGETRGDCMERFMRARHGPGFTTRVAPGAIRREWGKFWRQGYKCERRALIPFLFGNLVIHAKTLRLKGGGD